MPVPTLHCLLCSGLPSTVPCHSSPFPKHPPHRSLSRCPTEGVPESHVVRKRGVGKSQESSFSEAKCCFVGGRGITEFLEAWKMVQTSWAGTRTGRGTKGLQERLREQCTDEDPADAKYLFIHLLNFT